MIGTKGGLIVVEEAVDFSDGGSSGGDRMNGLAGAVDWSNEGNAARAYEVGGGRESEGKVSMDTITFVRRNSRCVAIQLSLCESNGSVGGRGSFGGDGAEDRDGKGSGDGGGGWGGGFEHGERDEEEGGKIYQLLLKYLKSLVKTRLETDEVDKL